MFILRGEKILNNKHLMGFTVLEVTVVLGIVVMGLLGIASLIRQNLQAEVVNRNYLTASMLAQEGLELTRNIRDENWLTSGANWDDNISTNEDGNITTFIIGYTGRASINYTPDSISDNGAKLYLNSDNYYDHNNSGAITPFRRLITVTAAAADKLDVVAEVQWQDHGQHNYTAETYLYNWR